MEAVNEPGSHPVEEGQEVPDKTYMLDVHEYLNTIHIPISQRIYAGSDSGRYLLDFFLLVTTLPVSRNSRATCR